ncbi:hypothetical protein D3C81_964650 [compost metagenome]
MKKDGSDIHIKTRSVMILSNKEYWNLAENTPVNIAITQLNTKLAKAIINEFHT